MEVLISIILNSIFSSFHITIEALIQQSRTELSRKQVLTESTVSQFRSVIMVSQRRLKCHIEFLFLLIPEVSYYSRYWVILPSIFSLYDILLFISSFSFSSKSLIIKVINLFFCKCGKASSKWVF